uniref:Fizzy and cell division cycle 20 related 1 n=1 Tax=Bos indicus x Bos taurus TaxID=30522 RepID=A0A4W2HWD2_BOBOX
MDQDYERRLLRQIVIQNENTMPCVAEMRRTLTPANSPVSSPSKHGDRFIPSRAGANWSVNFHRINENEKSPSQNRKAKDATSDNGKDGLAYSALLKNELLGAGIEKVQDPQTEDRRLQPSTPERKGLFTYSLSTKRSSPDDGNDVSPYSLSPVSNKSQKLLRSPRKPTRKISKIPFKVLDAPELQDDFYLNLVDWSSLNVLSVGLGTCVYLWSACTSQVTRLCDLSVEGDSVTSVGWSERGNLVAVGTHKGFVQIWDAAAGKKLSMLEGHTARVGALAWNADQLSSGSRDRMILQRDIRTPPLQSERRLQGHRQEVCGLKWSTDHQLLASGGNDNKLLVWNHSSLSPVQQYTEHLAAVKAIAWSPHQHGLLASGGGTADRCIRFWNTLTGQPLQCIDTGSQVCNLAWSKHANELAMSPDGEAIVTGAGDETLRFWNVFSKTRSTKVKWVGISTRCSQLCAPSISCPPPPPPCQPGSLQDPPPLCFCITWPPFTSWGAHHARCPHRPLLAQSLGVPPGRASLPRLSGGAGLSAQHCPCVSCRSLCPSSTSSLGSGKPTATGRPGRRATPCQRAWTLCSPPHEPKIGSRVGREPGLERT